MLARHVPSSALLGAVLVLVPCGSRAASTAPPDHRKCITAHADGQVFRDGGQLLAAQQEFATCASAACPTVVRKDCAELGTAVLASIPTLIVAAVDERGRSLLDVRVTLDGRSLPSTLDGAPIPVDPGEHQLRFERPDGSIRELAIVARETEKRRRIVATFADERPAQRAPEPASRVPTAVFVLGGVGVLALGSFSVFALSARDLEDCAPGCTRAEVDRIRTRYLWADVSLAASALSFGAAAVVWLGSSKASSGTSLPSRFRLVVVPELAPRAVGLSASGGF